MYRVLTTSTGDAITVVMKPAPNADVKWHGRLSVMPKMSESNKKQILFQPLTRTVSCIDSFYCTYMHCVWFVDKETPKLDSLLSYQVKWACKILDMFICTCSTTLGHKV